MDFGRVDPKQLSAVNFSLPPEPLWNARVLQGPATVFPQVYIGCPRWAAKEWVGTIYPKGTRPSGFLDAYIKQYNTIELNATHHTFFTTEAIKDWAKKAEGTGFKFCPKVFKGISHSGLLTDKQALTADFLEAVLAFGPHLGPIFLQLSDSFGPERKSELFHYLSFLPSSISFFIEVRHPAWFVAPHFTDLLTTLRNNNIGLLVTDAGGRRDSCHMHLTTEKAMIRFAGNNLHPSNYSRIDDWVHRINLWLQKGLTELYFFVHLQNEIHLPELTIYLIEKLNAVCGLSIKQPAFVQPRLFN